MDSTPASGGRVAGSTPVWDDRRWSTLPALKGEQAADFCVVGLGGSGLACISELLRLGASVIGIDAGSVAGRAAGRNAGFLLAGLADSHHDAVDKLGRKRAYQLYAHTLDELERIIQETPAFVRRTGSLRIAADAAELEDCARQLEAMRADGFVAENYDGPEGRGLLIPGDGVSNPLARCRELARRVITGGARLFENSSVLRITSERAETASGTVRCRNVLVLVDGALPRIFPELRSHMRAARLQMLATSPDLPVRFPRPVYFRYGFEYWQQLEDGCIALGGLRDRFIDSEWTEDPEPSVALQSALEKFLRDHIRARAPVTHRWAATACYTESGLPFVGEVRPRVWAAGAYSGTGNVVGALCGRALARHLAAGDDRLLAVLT